MTSKDPLLLHFGHKKYADRLKDVMEKPNLKMLSAPVLENQRKELVICCMDFAFIGGSMGAVVGEKSQEELITQLKTTCLCDDFKIRWRQNDGSCLFFNAISQTSVS
jgi:acetyl-CoA carboxylase beta subunit